MKKIIILIIFLFTSTSIFSQSISLFDIDTTAFPIMKAKFFAFDKDGNLQRPSAIDLKLSENGIERKILSVTCSNPKPVKAISSVLVMDVSGSMSSGGSSGIANIDLAKQASISWINALPTANSQCAITSFDGSNYLIQDFTTDKTSLLNAINKLVPKGGTDYDAALYNPMAGGIPIARKGKYRKVVIILTDGMPNQEPQVQSIINEANNNGIMIFAVTLGMPCPGNLKEITTKTGGLWYENVTTLENARQVYFKIMNHINNGEVCEITWESDFSCIYTSTNIELSWKDQKSYSVYTLPSSSIAVLNVKPNYLSFGKRLPSTQNDTTITLTAKNADFNITGISRKFGYSDFSVINQVFPIFIPKNSTKDITIRFIPSDSNLKYASFEIETDKCNTYFSTNGGFQEKKTTTSSLKLTHPNGGETFVVGSDTIITWTGVSPTDTVSLEYSIDNGTSWKIISKQVTGLKYKWEQIPKPTSQYCIIKVRQLLKSNTNIKDNVRILRDTTLSNRIINMVYSPNGRYIATVANEVYIKIWDVNSGSLLRYILGSNQKVTCVTYSPNGKRIISGSTDNIIMIWDSTWSNLLSNDVSVFSIAYSPDGKNFVTGGSDGTIKIWDANTGVLIQTLKGHTNLVYSLAYSPDGINFTSGSEDNTIKIWNAKTGELIRTLTGHTNWVYSVTYSPDGRTIASGSEDNSIKIWDAITGTLLRTFSSISIKNSIFSVAFSPDGRTIAAGSNENYIKIWDVNTGALLRTIPSDNIYDSFYCVAFSPDGSTIAAGNNFGEIKIWDVDVTTLQEDQSDSVFSIVAPTPSSIDIDMKQCLVGKSRDSLVSTFVQNKGTYQFRVDSIAIKGKDANQFMIVSGIPPFDVPASDSRAVEFRFKPNSVGIKTAQVVIYTQADTLIQNIQGEGVSPSLSIINNLIDFGIVKINSKKDSLGVFTIKNIGSAPLKIDSITQGGPNSEDFSTLSASGTFTLAKDESAKLDLRFSPLEKGRTSGSVLFHYNGVGSPAQVQLFGRAFDKASATLNSDTLEAFPGEIIQIPIYLKDVEDLEYSSTTNFKVNLTFNATLLEPIGDTPTGTLNSDNTRTVELELPTKVDEHGVLRYFKFKVGLGDDSTTKLILHKPSADAGDVDLQVESGVFNLLGICRAAGPRLINPNGEVKLSLIRPNPVGDNGELDIETIENGQTELYIINLKGEKVATLYQGELAAGKQTLIISTKDLSNGTYFVILQTPTVTQKVKMEVVK